MDTFKPAERAIDQVSPGRPKPHQHRDWGGVTVALILGLSGLMLGRLGILWIRFDVFSQFSMQFYFLTGAAIIGLIMPRFKSLCAAVLFVMFIALYGLWPFMATGGAEASPAAGEKRLSVAQFNIHGADADAAAVVAAVRSLDPDVMTLVEIDVRNRPILEALKAQWPYQSNCWSIGVCDAAIISKFPLSEMKGQGEWAGPSYVMARLGDDFGNLTVVGVHTTRFPHAKAQFTQVQELAKLLGQTRGKMLVMGDFNATPFSRVTQLLESTLGLSLRTSMPSWPADRLLPQIAIDHIFTSSGVRPLSGERAGLAGGSDHLPIGMTIAIAVQ